MYQHLNEVQQLLKNYIETIPNTFSKVFYQSRINRFFEDYMSKSYNSARPLNTINFHDINTFIEDLDSSNAEKMNYYYAFSGFFKYTYHTDRIPTDVMKGVNKPQVILKEKKYIDNKSINKLKVFVNETTEPIEDRLLVGLFLYSGLSRKYIANLTQYQISFGNRFISLFFDFGDITRCIPLNTNLATLIKSYFESLDIINPYEKIFKLDENYISEKIKILSKNITEKTFTPTDFSNTFIQHALQAGNDILTISELTMESVSTIMKHVAIDEEEIINKQIQILEGIFEGDDNIT
ncbi:tyrosine-type recombinase/integrase [Paenibacillus apiarius]|uniref:tyrosine-type recombinase/integrase n=1 Tax=Paenibacillus apiarius TaxID=46240 RepID=UPI001981652E|nr:site-specific integrase [Paenibacillus apiarius]MBN3526420.1 site-specific integrase [Paenibacillus apiarius]